MESKIHCFNTMKVMSKISGLLLFAVTFSAAEKIDIETGRKHWAFQPIKKPALPVVKNATWAANPIDRFILAKLEAANLQPAPRAG